MGSADEWESDQPVALYFNGDSWKEVDTGQQNGVAFTDVDTTSSGSGWITVDDRDSSGARDAVINYNDDGWDTHEFPGSGGGAVVALADNDVWYVAGSAEGGAVARHYDGGEWTATDLPADGKVHISSVQAGGSDDVWAVGQQGDQPYAAHWDGSGWQVVSPEGGDEFDASLTDVAFVDGAVWAVGKATSDASAKGLFYRFDGTAWQPKKLPDIEYGVGVSDVGAGPDGSLWLSSDESNIVYAKTAKGWAEVKVPDEEGAATGVDDFTSAGGKVWVVGTSVLNDVEYHGVLYQGS